MNEKSLNEKFKNLLNILKQKSLIESSECNSLLESIEQTNSVDTVIIDYIKTEYEGFFSEHQNMWRIFSGTIKLYLTVLAAPILLTKLFTTKDTSGTVTILNEYWFALLGVGLLGLVFSALLIRLRLDTLLYAKWLNGIRFYLCTKCSEFSELMETAQLPSRSPNEHSFIESPKRPIWYLILFSGLANSYYISVGLNKKFLLDPCYWVLVLVGVVVHIAAYYIFCSGPQTAGLRSCEYRENRESSNQDEE